VSQTRSPADIDSRYLVDFLSRAIAYPTPVTDEGEQDDRILGFLEELMATELERLGLDFVDFDEMGNVCGRLNGIDRSQPPLLLIGFSMTHPAASMSDAFTPRLADGSEFEESGQVVVGRGAGEQKGPLASVVAALETLQRAGDRPTCDVHLVCLASGETGKHDAVRSAIEHFRLEPAGAVVAVCTGNDIVIGHKGRLDIEVTIRGRSGHSSSPDLGVNALEGAAEVMARIGRIELGDPDPDLGPRTLTPVRLETFPKAAHTIPAEARLMLDCRLLPGDTRESTLARVTDALAGLGPFRVEAKGGDFMYPSDVPADSWLVESLAKAVESVTGSSPSLHHISAATDSGYLNSHGIPAVLFGPGDIRKAHTDQDYVVVDEAVAAARSLVRLMTT
jgi:succinyl-diaminopimelate desuccinylase